MKKNKKPIIYPCKLEQKEHGLFSVLVEATDRNEVFSDFHKLLLARSVGVNVNHASDVVVNKLSQDFFNLTGYSHRLTIHL